MEFGNKSVASDESKDVNTDGDNFVGFTNAKQSFSTPSRETPKRVNSSFDASSQSKAMDIINSIRFPVKTPKPTTQKRPNSDTKIQGKGKRILFHSETSPPPCKVAKPEVVIESWSLQASQVDSFSTQDDISFLEKLQNEDIPSQKQETTTTPPSPLPPPLSVASTTTNELDNYDDFIKDIDMSIMDSDEGPHSKPVHTPKRDTSPLGSLFSSRTPTKMKYPAPVLIKSNPQSTQKPKVLGSTRVFKQAHNFQPPTKGRVFVSPEQRAKPAGSPAAAFSSSLSSHSPRPMSTSLYHILLITHFIT